MSPESGTENARLEMLKAEAALRAARALLDLDLGDDAVSRAYYAVRDLLRQGSAAPG